MCAHWPCYTGLPLADPPSACLQTAYPHPLRPISGVFDVSRSVCSSACGILLSIILFHLHSLPITLSADQWASADTARRGCMARLPPMVGIFPAIGRQFLTLSLLFLGVFRILCPQCITTQIDSPITSIEIAQYHEGAHLGLPACCQLTQSGGSLCCARCCCGSGG